MSRVHDLKEQRHAPRGCTGALVIGGDYRALGVVRSLGRRRIPVCVLVDEHVVAAQSRYCSRRMPWPDREPQQMALLVELARCHSLRDWTIFPSGDEAVALVARNHDELGRHFRLTTPPWEVVRWAYDKRLTHVLATELGVDQPWTRCPGSHEAVERLDCPFPVILKPAIKASFNDLTHDKAWLVVDRAELVRRYGEAAAMVGPDVVMVQELVPGGGMRQFSFAALCRQGEPIAWLTARRSRQYPLDFGRASSFVETIECPEIEAPSRRILKAMRYDGLIEVEFKHDPEDGKYKLLDLNPRVWGWHSIGKAAGVDFAYLQWRMAQGEAVAEARGRSGVRWMRGITDLPAVAGGLRRGELSIADYLRSLAGPMQFALFAIDDPVPGLLDFPLLVRLALRRGVA